MVGVLITTTIMKEERAAAWTKFGWISSGHNVQLMPIYKKKRSDNLKVPLFPA